MKLLLGEKIELKLNLPPSHRKHQNPINKLLSNYYQIKNLQSNYNAY